MAGRTIHPLPKRPVSSFPSSTSAPRYPTVSTTPVQPTASTSTPAVGPAANIASPTTPLSSSTQAYLSPPITSSLPLGLLPQQLLPETGIIGTEYTLPFDKQKQVYITLSRWRGTTDELEAVRRYVVASWGDQLMWEGMSVVEVRCDRPNEGELDVYTLSERAGAFVDLEMPTDSMTLLLTSYSSLTLSGCHLLKGFFNALRIRILHSIVSQSNGDTLMMGNDSFIIRSPGKEYELNEWASPWSRTRSLIQVFLTLSFIPETLTIHILPIPRISSFFPLPPPKSLELKHGLRVQLSPHNTPAYYIGPWDKTGQLDLTQRLHDEWSGVMDGLGGIGDDDEWEEVWISVLPYSPSTSAPPGSASQGVKIIYPRSLILMLSSSESPTHPKGILNEPQHSAYELEPPPTLTNRAKEIAAFIDGFMKERARKASGGTNTAGVSSSSSTSFSTAPTSTVKKEGVGGKKKESEPDEKESEKQRDSKRRKMEVDSPAQANDIKEERKDEDSSDEEPLAAQSAAVTVPKEVKKEDDSSQLISSSSNIPSSDPIVPPTPTGSNKQSQPQDTPRSRVWDMQMDFDMIEPSASFGSGMMGTGGVTSGGGPEGGMDFTDDDFDFFRNPALGVVGGDIGIMSTDHTGQSSLSANPPAMSTDTLDSLSLDGAISEALLGLPSHRPPSDRRPSSASSLIIPPSSSQQAVSVDGLHSSQSPPRPSSSTSSSASENDGPTTPPSIFSSVPTSGPGIFDAISFGPDWIVPTLSLLDTSKTQEKSIDWKSAYNEKTDPRIGIVRLLKSLRQGKTTESKGERDKHQGWSDNIWESTGSLYDGEAVVNQDEESTDESADEEEDMLSPIFDQPLSTSPAKDSVIDPSHLPLPLGANLVLSQFTYSSLLPHVGSSPMPPQSDAYSPTLGASSAPPIATMATSAASAPTPVSPSANAIDRQKVMEGAANVLAKEVCENPIFLESIRKRRGFAALDGTSEDIWDRDRKRIQEVLHEGLGKTLTVASVVKTVESWSEEEKSDHTQNFLKRLEAPNLSLAQNQQLTSATTSSYRLEDGNPVIHIAPTAMRFWDKLGLAPRGGPKDVLVYAIGATELDLGSDETATAERDEERRRRWQKWLKSWTDCYTKRNFGNVVLGNVGLQGLVDGLAGYRWDSWRKQISNIIAQVPSEEQHPHIVLFLVIPAELVSLSSTNFRQLLQFIRKTTKATQQLIFQLVPEHLTYEDELVYPTNRFLNVDLLSLSVYDRLLQRCERMMSRMFFVRGLERVAYLQKPAFAIARDPGETRFSFSSSEDSANSVDVVDKHLFIQVAYQFSKCGKWVVGVCCDQLGEAHDVRVWANTSDEEEGDNEVPVVPNPIQTLVDNVWNFAMDFASKANIEWRVVISKLGMMENEELDVWSDKLQTAFNDASTRAMHVSIMSVQQDVQWSFLPREIPAPPPKEQAEPFNKTNTILSDVSAFTFSFSVPPGFHDHLSISGAFDPPPFVMEPDPSTIESIPPTTQANVNQEVAVAELIHSTPKYPIPLLSTAMVHIPRRFVSAPCSASTTILHLLHMFGSSRSTMMAEMESHMNDIAHNYYQLEILARARMGATATRLRSPLHVTFTQVILEGLELLDGFLDS